MAEYHKLLKAVNDTIEDFCSGTANEISDCWPVVCEYLDELLDEHSEKLAEVIEIDKRIKRQSMSVKRQKNLATAFPAITWDFQNIQLFKYGLYGDRTSFTIPGRYKGIKVQYTHRTPGGGVSCLHVFKDGKKKSIRPAPFIRAKVAMIRLDSFIA